jgi:hypothetical protein
MVGRRASTVIPEVPVGGDTELRARMSKSAGESAGQIGITSRVARRVGGLGARVPHEVARAARRPLSITWEAGRQDYLRTRIGRAPAHAIVRRGHKHKGNVISHVRRFDHVGITVADLDAATQFFVALGLEIEGRTFVESAFIDTVTGIPDSQKPKS